MGQDGLRIARAADHPWGLITAHWGVGCACLLQGKVEQAIATLEPAVQWCETWRIPLLFPNSAILLGQAYVLAGRIADAQSLLERATQQTVVVGNLVYCVAAMLALGEAHLVAGQWDRAQA